MNFNDKKKKGPQKKKPKTFILIFIQKAYQNSFEKLK